MKAGDLIKVKASYFELSWNPIGIIVDDLGTAKIGPGLSVRKFQVLFDQGEKMMYEYEMDVINAN